MMKKKMLLGAAVLALSSTSALAGDQQWYVSGSGGAMWSGKLADEDKLVAGKKGFDADGKERPLQDVGSLKTDLAAAVFVGAGYGFNENFRIGVEGFYLNPKRSFGDKGEKKEDTSDKDSKKDNLKDKNDGDASGKPAISGGFNMTYYGAMPMVHVHMPLGESADIFVGAGVGYAWGEHKSDVKTEGLKETKGGEEDLKLDRTFKGHHVAGQVTIGGSYKHEDVITVDLQYRLFAALPVGKMTGSDGKEYVVMNDKGNREDFSVEFAHVGTIGIRKDI